MVPITPPHHFFGACACMFVFRCSFIDHHPKSDLLIDFVKASNNTPEKDFLFAPFLSVVVHRLNSPFTCRLKWLTEW